MRARLRLLLGIALLAAAAHASAAEKIIVAAAANMAYVMGPLDAAFERAQPGAAVASEIGASGSLVAQIANGAPYDVFLSADLEFPRKLVAMGGADGASLVTYAFGRLVLWTTRPELGLASVESVVRDPRVLKIAMANPDTAPYGRAAEEALGRLGLTDAARPKIVIGDNITQTAQFVSSGNADAGFVAYSLVAAPNLRDRGRWIEVPAALYTPIAQGAVLTRRGMSNPAARRYMQFLASRQARDVLAQFGYRLP
jgi:molybdate transport system substrate-binding protein